MYLTLHIVHQPESMLMPRSARPTFVSSFHVPAERPEPVMVNLGGMTMVRQLLSLGVIILLVWAYHSGDSSMY